MNLFNSFLLVLLLFRIQLGKSFKSSWYLGSKQGDSSPSPANVIQMTEVIPYSKMKSISVKGSLESTPPLLWKRQEFWQGIHPSRNRIIAVPQRALLVEREKALSTYNWNSFGLRYGKRQTVNANGKL